ncbi:hypothetical protein M5K25_027329 [Dendrobium thyrsiflorum]|uniref:Myb-like domain-containing protein n=1 Tax=Dendrobium thyrsiflorum TaxID=117978 RepID=A0ABD0TZV7_DENTH
MSSDKVLLTYKRKRFSFQTDFIHDTKATNLPPNIQRGSSWISSLKSECDANDEKLNNHHSGKCQCSTCNGRCGFTECLQQHIPPTEGMKQSQITVQKDMGPMVLRSSRVLSSIKVENVSKQATSPKVTRSLSNNKDIIQMDGSGRKSGLTSAEERSTALLAVHDLMGNPINLNVNLATEGVYGSGCPEVGAKMGLHSDNSHDALFNDAALKEHSCAQLITFSRRAKTKQDAGERITDRYSKIVEKQSVSAISSHCVVGANFGCEGSSQKCRFEEQVNCQPMLFEEQVNCQPMFLENCVVPSSQVDVADEMAVKVDATSDYTAEVCTGSMIKQRLDTSSECLMPALSAMDTCEEPSKELLAVQPIYVVKDYICPLNTEPSNSGNNAFIFDVEESGSKLITGTNNCEKRIITCISEERECPAGLQLSVAPTSVSQMNLEANKRSDDAMLENHRDSQSSSTPGCSIVFTDEENDARSKEVEWLESLDNVLREKKKDRSTGSLIVDDVINCREGFTSLTANKSSEQSVNNKNVGIDFVNHLITLPEKISVANLPDSSCEEQPKTDKSTSFTDFLGRYLPSNSGVPLDLNAAAPPSGSHFRDNVSMHNWKHPYSPNGNSSLFKHKHIAEMMLNGKRGSLSDKPKRYSSEWSEEELDFLWIGVRRHGVDNWNAVLRDPKLQFAQSRFPEDLALQWEQEQKKLYNGILYPPARLLKTNSFSPSLREGHYNAKAHSYSENPLFTETKLSLGGVYFHKENITKSSPFGFTYPPTSESSSTCPLLGSFLSMSLHPGAAIRHKSSSSASRSMYQMDHGFHKQFRERSGTQQKPAGLPKSTDLPHWLKEACSSHPSPSDLPWPQFFTAGNATSLIHNDTGLCSPTAKHGEPLTSKDLRGRGILKRKSMISGKNTGIIKIEEASPSVEDSLGINLCVAPIQIPACERPAIAIGASHQKNITDLSNNIPVSVVPNDLVVLDSDASSEETISDDQNRRP